MQNTAHSRYTPRPKAPQPAAVTPEIAAVIELAVNAYLGKKATIISVKLVSDSQASRSWVDHGLTLIHGSHNMVQRGR